MRYVGRKSLLRTNGNSKRNDTYTMRKLILTLCFCLIASPCFSAEYYVYVRLEDRAGVKVEDDVGRSKRGDVVDVRPVNKTTTPGERAYKEWYIFKADLTKAQVEVMKEPWEKEEVDDKTGEIIQIPVAYRKNRIDLSVLKATKPELNEAKVAPAKIQLSAKSALDLARYSENQRYYAYHHHKNFAETYVSKFSDWLIRPAYAATVTSTINKAGEDYDTLTLWEDAKDGDLVTATTIQQADCYDDDGTLSDKFIVDGSTTDASYYMKITSPVGERHTGTAGTGFVLTATAVANGGAVILINDNYLVVEWIEIAGYTGVSNNTSFYAIEQDLLNANSTLAHLLIHDDGATNEQSRVGAILIKGSALIYNNIIYNIAHYGITNVISYSNCSVYNNTLYDFNQMRVTGWGISVSGNGGNVINNIVMNEVSKRPCFVYDADATNDYNASSDATANSAHDLNSGSGTPPTTADFVSVGGGTEDLHLVADAVEIDLGTDLGTVAWSVDIDGRDRDTEADTWDIGADEYVSAVTARRRMWIQ